MINDRAVIDGARIERSGCYFHILRPSLSIRHRGLGTFWKRGERGNGCCQNVAHLQTEIMEARERVRRLRSMIQACAHACGLTSKAIDRWRSFPVVPLPVPAASRRRGQEQWPPGLHPPPLSSQAHLGAVPTA